MPASRREFWEAKISSNKARDVLNLDRLREAGWRTLTVWECAIRGPSRLALEEVLETSANWILSDRPALEIRGTV
jgi:DNA mismatch endonuclease (patch repair protein)